MKKTDLGGASTRWTRAWRNVHRATTATTTVATRVTTPRRPHPQPRTTTTKSTTAPQGMTPTLTRGSPTSSTDRATHGIRGTPWRCPPPRWCPLQTPSFRSRSCPHQTPSFRSIFGGGFVREKFALTSCMICARSNFSRFSYQEDVCLNQFSN